MSHSVQARLTRTQAEAVLEGLQRLIDENPSDHQAQSAWHKIDRALDRRASARDQPRGRFALDYEPDA